MNYDDFLSELAQMRVRLDQIAAHITGEKTRYELMPIWHCGHRHQTRLEASKCFKAQQGQQEDGA
jgi:hypothetical protein